MEEHKGIPKKNGGDETKGNAQAKNADSDGIIPAEILENIPEEERGKVVSIMKQSMFSGIVKRTNPISDKITYKIN